MTTQKKLALYAAAPIAALSIFGASLASANGMFGFGQNQTPEQVAQNQTTRFQNEANLLGISVDDVKNAWAQGQTFQELATSHGITEDQLRQKMQDQRLQNLKTNLQTLVSQGVITQAQADQRLQFIQQQQQTNNQGKGFGRGHGMGMGMMGM